jgi:cupin superfamily acireductone dioxygenase involved in methionine salvage
MKDKTPEQIIIAEWRAKDAALAEEVERYSQMAFQYGAKCEGLLAENERLTFDIILLRAENKRLREALENICAEYTAPLSRKVAMFDIARAALQPKGEKDG